jgi:hypothetical protein
MKKEFINYTEALALKELGFDEPCFMAYYHLLSEDKKDKLFMRYNDNKTNSDNAISAPLYQQAFRWFREKYKLHTWIYQVDNGKFFFSSLKNGRYLVCNIIEFATYEEAELECLKKLIEIVKEK